MIARGYLIGAGSMSLGVERAGFELLPPVETPGYAVNARSWDLNRPQSPHLVQELDEREPVRGDMADLDLLYGNPPCGGMSSVTNRQGKKKASSSTNLHMIAWAKMAVRTRPRAILMENGSNLVTGSGQAIFDELCQIFQRGGYSCWPWLGYSWQWGTPQVRRRCFVVAMRDRRCTVDDISPGQLPQVPPESTWADVALRPLEPFAPSPEPFKVVMEDEVGSYQAEIANHWWDKGGLEINKDFVLHGERLLLGNFMPPARYDLLTERAAAGDVASKVELEKFGHLVWRDCPQRFKNAWTFAIPRRAKAGEPAHSVTSYRLVHPHHLRLLTMRENALLMGYPLDWKFHAMQMRFVAQGVPVANAEWAARRIKEMLAS